MDTQSICFCVEIRQIFIWIPLLSGALNTQTSQGHHCWYDVSSDSVWRLGNPWSAWSDPFSDVMAQIKIFRWQDAWKSEKKKKMKSKCLERMDISLALNSLATNGDFCRLLITFANSLDTDQARQSVGPNLDPNCLTLMVFLKDFFKKLILKKNPHTTKNKKITQHAKSSLFPLDT